MQRPRQEVQVTVRISEGALELIRETTQQVNLLYIQYEYEKQLMLCI